jgi:aminomethyltransferase
MAEALKRTPIYDEHRAAGGKLIPFAGWEMPVQYETGIVREHQAVRDGAGLFDVSHMGELEIRGPGALDLVQYVTTNDASTLEVGQAQYSVLCTEAGTALDDCLVYRFADRFMIVTNASNHGQDRAWIERHAGGFDVEVVDRSDETGLLALQGPNAQAILGRLTDTDLDGIGYYRFAEGDVAGHPTVISRTGYTGEDGFELYLPAAASADVWRRLMAAGSDEGLLPVGLGARDSLRLEMGYILYGNDLDERRTPLEAGLGWVVKLDKGEFLGRRALETQKQIGLRERLVGFSLRERGFPRHGYEVRAGGEAVGEVTSGLLSPSLDRGVGLAYVAVEAAKPGTAVDIMIRGKPVPAEVTRPPFYREGSVRK